jgi:hypothetical protein
MMVGNYQKGAIDFMVDVQFRQAAREDLALTFIEPTSGRALHELAALPGVDFVEGFRDVPAILRFRHYQHRAAPRCSASSPKASCTARSTAACSRWRRRPAAWC